MSAFETLLSQGMIERLGWTLIHSVWQTVVVASLLVIVLRLLHRCTANLRYIVACLALAAMIALPLMTLRLVRVSGPVAEAGPLPVAAPPASTPALAEVVDVKEIPEFPGSPMPLEAADLTAPVPWQQRFASALEPALPYLVLGWLAGVFGLSAWHLGGWAQLQRLKRRIVHEVAAPLQETLGALAEQLGVHRAVRLLESAIIEVPTVVGWIKPVILLPASALTGLNTEQLEAVLAHELAHVRRYDYLVNMLQTVAEILGFYHPALWWVSHKIRVERENCCDDLAVRVCGDSMRYVKALTHLEEVRHRRTELAVAATGGSLVSRIGRLIGRPPVDTRRFAWLPGLIALLLVVAVVIPAALVFGEVDAPDDRGIELDQADGRRVLQKSIEANRYWLIGPASEVTDYSYDFSLHIAGGPADAPRGPMRVVVEDPRQVDGTMRQGIYYRSVLHELAENPANADIQSAGDEGDLIHLAVAFHERVDLGYGNEMAGMDVAHGMFRMALREAHVWVHKGKQVPVRIEASSGSLHLEERLSQYVCVAPGQYVPLQIDVFKESRGEEEAGLATHFHFDFKFNYFEPGLWLFDQSRYVAGTADGPLVDRPLVASTGNIVVNGTPRTKTAPAVRSAPNAIRSRLEEAAQQSRSAAHFYMLGRRLRFHAEAHRGRYPANLAALWADASDGLPKDFSAWFNENAAYLGQGQTLSAPKNAPIAYDKRLLTAQEGTNVLFNNGRVTFVKREELDKLGIPVTATSQENPGTVSVARVQEASGDSEDEETAIRVDFVVAEVLSDQVLDYETAVQVREILSLESKTDLQKPLWDVLFEHVIERGLLGERAKALMDLLTARGYAEVIAVPTLTMLDGHNAQITGTDTPGPDDPNDTPQREIKLDLKAETRKEQNATLLTFDLELRRVLPAGPQDDPPVAQVTAIATTAMARNGEYLLTSGGIRETDADAGGGGRMLLLLARPEVVYLHADGQASPPETMPMMGLKASREPDRSDGASARSALQRTTISVDQAENAAEADDTPRTQILLHFVVAEIFSDQTLDRETALQVHDLLARAKINGECKGLDSLPSVERLQEPLWKVVREYVTKAKLAGHALEELTDLLVPRGYAEIHAKHIVLLPDGQKGTVNVKSPQDPNAPGDRDRSKRFDLTLAVTAKIPEDANTVLLETELTLKHPTTWRGDNGAPLFRVEGGRLQIAPMVRAGQYSPLVLGEREDADGRRRLPLLLIRPTVISARDSAPVHIRETGQSAKDKRPDAERAHIRLDVVIARALRDEPLDRDTAMQLAGLLAEPQSVDQTGSAASAATPTADQLQQLTPEMILRRRGGTLLAERLETAVDLFISRGYLEVLARPTLEVVEGHRAQIASAGETSCGLKLGVTPQAREKDDATRLDIEFTLAEEVPRPDGSADLPVVRKRSASTAVVVPNGKYFAWPVWGQGQDIARTGETIYLMVKPSITKPAMTVAEAKDEATKEALKASPQWREAANTVPAKEPLVGVGIGDAKPTRFLHISEEQRVDREFGFEKLLHEEGNQWEITKPFIKLFLTDFTCSVTADRGQVRLEAASGRPICKEATFSGNVVIHVTPREPNDASDCLIRLDDVTFDAERSEFCTSGSFKIVCGGNQLAGRGLNLRFDKSRIQLDFLGAKALVGPYPPLSQSGPLSIDPEDRKPHREVPPVIGSAAKQGGISPEQVLVVRKAYVDSDPMVVELTKRIAEIEAELIVARQTLAAQNPEVVQKQALLEAFNKRLAQKRRELEREFDEDLAKRSAVPAGGEADSRAKAARAPTVTATFAGTDLLDALTQVADQTGTSVHTDATVKPQPVTAECAGLSVGQALRTILARTPYAFKKAGATYLVYRPITLRFRDESLLRAASDLATAAGVTIITHQDVTGLVSAEFEDVPLDTALDILLAGTPYMVKRTPDYYLVAPRRADAHPVRPRNSRSIDNPPVLGKQAPMDPSDNSRAWYIMRQLNCPPLLLGLTQQLTKVLEPSRLDAAAWQDVDNGGRLRLKVDIEGVIPGEVIVGLFKDARWLAEPVAVRRLDGAGTYTLTGLPPGQYQIGAMMGEPPVPNALGVQRIWPEAVEIKRREVSAAEILVSERFRKCASGWYNESVSRDYLGDWGDLDESNLLQGRLTGPDGQPIRFAEILIREHRIDPRRGIAAPNRGTNERGLYKYDEMAWPYRVIARWREPLPSVFGHRYQTTSLNRVLNGTQRVDFQFERFPEGTAVVKGRVTDQAGRPVKGFFIRIIAPPLAQLRSRSDELDGGTDTYVGYDVPFISEDGRFELTGLPAGTATVDPIPFETRRYESEWGKDVVLEADRTSTVEFELVGKDVFYGRLLFDDGAPAVIQPAPWPGAVTRILLTTGGRGLGIGEVDNEGHFVVYLDDRQVEQLRSRASRLMINVPTDIERRWATVGEYPFEKLSEKRNAASKVKVTRPAPTPVLAPEERIGRPLPESWKLEYREGSQRGGGRRMTDVIISVDIADHEPAEARRADPKGELLLYSFDGRLAEDIRIGSTAIVQKTRKYFVICRKRKDPPGEGAETSVGPFLLDLSRPGRYTLTLPGD